MESEEDMPEAVRCKTETILVAMAFTMYGKVV